MGLFDHFPYTNFHELNLMWILQALKEIQTTTEQFVALNSLKYADPIQWNITSQYEKNTIVIDPMSGIAYISVQPVPSGVIITNTDYWTIVFDLSLFIRKSAQNFTANYEEESTLTASHNMTSGQWLVLNDVLYLVLNDINAGDQYIIWDGAEGNIIHFTIEDVIGHLQDLSTSNKSNIVAAIDEVFNITMTALNSGKNFTPAYDPTDTDIATISVNDTQWLTWHNMLYIATSHIDIGDQYVIGTNIQPITMEQIIGHLNNLNTTDKSNIVAAIVEVNQKVNDNVTTITNIQSEVDQLNIVTATTRKVICIGDSYLGGSGPVYAETESWGAMLRMILQNGSDTIINGYGGSGFIGQVPDHTYIILLQEVAESLTEAERAEITDIIVQGGLNDKYGFNQGTQTEYDLQTAISTFTAYAHTTFPNATVRIGVIGWATDGLSDKNQWNKILNCYKNYFNPQCPKLQYMSGVEYIMPTMQDSDYSDTVHPNATSSYRIATGIANCIMGGTGDNVTNLTDIPIALSWVSGVTEIGNQLKLTIYGSSATISATEIWFSYDTPVQFTFSNYNKIADISNLVPVRASLGFDMPCNIWLIDDNNQEIITTGILRVLNKQLYLTLNQNAVPINVSQIIIKLGSHSSSVFNIC